VRAAHGRAARAAHAELLQPDVRGHAEPHARADAADEGHAQRAQPNAGAARAWRGARLRRVHGALQRLLPRKPAVARRAPRADGAVDGADAAAAQLDDARATRAAAGTRRVAARGHGPALAGRPARTQPAAGVPAAAVGAADGLPR